MDQIQGDPLQTLTLVAKVLAECKEFAQKVNIESKKFRKDSYSLLEKIIRGQELLEDHSLTSLHVYEERQQLKNVVAESIASLNSLTDDCFNCCNCHRFMDENKSFLCLQCNLDVIRSQDEDERKDCVITNFSEAENNLLCGGCVLLNGHTDHESMLYLPMKMKHQAESLRMELENALKTEVTEQVTLGSDFVYSNRQGRDILKMVQDFCENAPSMSSSSVFEKGANSLRCMVHEIVHGHRKTLQLLQNQSDTLKSKLLITSSSLGLQ